MELLIGLLLLLLLVAPILAIAAFVRVQKLAALTKEQNLPNLIGRIYAIEQRIATFEKRLAAVMAAPAVAPAAPQPSPEKPVAAPPAARPAATPPLSTPAPSPPMPVGIYAAPPLHVSEAKSASSLDLETLIAGRWLNRIGILALLFAVSFFLKYAFDNNWIGPSGRVAIGILLGAAMLPWSQWLLRRGYPYFSEGIAGLGEAVLFLSVWAGWRYYALFGQTTAFVAMIFITAVMAAVALGRDSQRIALLSLLGGFLTPQLVSTGKDQQIVLFTYIAILGAGLLVMAARREWRSLAPVSFVLTQVYFWGWYECFYTAAKLDRTIFFASVFFLLYAALPVLRSARLGRLLELDIILLILNAGVYLVALYAMLWPQDRWTLTVFVLVLSAGHVVVANLAPAPVPSGARPAQGQPPLVRLLFGGFALTFATLAIPIRLEGKWITLAFAIEGAILIWTGLRSSTWLLRLAGFSLFAVAAFRLLAFPILAPQAFFNARFAAYAVLVFCFGAALYAARERWSEIGENEQYAYGLLAVATNVFSLIALSLEVWDLFGPKAGNYYANGALGQHLALSLLWTAYATFLILLGVARGSALLRWQALALFGLVVGKVFFFDLSYLERFYRILSFLILGLVLLVVSFLYQRKVAQERSRQ